MLIMKSVGSTKTPKYNATQAMLERSRAVQRFCYERPYNKPPRVSYGKSLVSMKGERLLYCPIPKAGWSTWKRLLYRDAGVEHLVKDFAHLGYESEWHKAGLKLINNKGVTTNFQHRVVFVRNPYERLVSAYSDKVLKNQGNYVRVMKSPCRVTNQPPALALTFQQFVQCIVQKCQKT
ncbi:CHST9 [Bugula neritina]|uniref:Carbohydrate sulfotransferase n=1 Tax=Bugula neritina TaxID=10212 RepID=A0A7J7J0C3_BUGNE|nr:CHST9 [Bugula neritina]